MQRNEHSIWPQSPEAKSNPHPFRFVIDHGTEEEEASRQKKFKHRWIKPTIKYWTRRISKCTNQAHRHWSPRPCLASSKGFLTRPNRSSKHIKETIVVHTPEPKSLAAKQLNARCPQQFSQRLTRASWWRQTKSNYNSIAIQIHKHPKRKQSKYNER